MSHIGAGEVAAVAREYARREFPSEPARAQRFAHALERLHATEAGRDVAHLLLERQIDVEVEEQDTGFSASYEMPFSSGTWASSAQALLGGDPLPHRLSLSADLIDGDEIDLTSTIAHEGAHFQLAMRPLVNVPIRIGAMAAGALAAVASLPTLGMLDATGRWHRPGEGALLAARQGQALVTSFFHEAPAYGVGDAVWEELGGTPDPYGHFRREDGSPRSSLATRWHIARDYMAGVSVDADGNEPPPASVVGVVAAPLIGLGVGIGTARLLRAVGVAPAIASRVPIYPGAIAMVAALGLSLRAE